MTPALTPGANSAGLSPLGRRIAAAFVMMPIVLAALWAGSPWWDLLLAGAAVLMAWEWSRLADRGVFGPPGWSMAAAVLAGLAAQRLLGPAAALAILAAGAAICAGIAAWAGGIVRATWFLAGTVYVGLPVMALLWLRRDPAAGFATVLWLLLLVWAIDSAAYAAGRSIGGPKLIPRLSPKKTWAGLGGGCLAAATLGYAAAKWLALPDPWPLVGFSAALAVIEQAGDALESAIKRHFGAKDSSGLIPGHGGILDRVDGLVAVALAVAAFALAVGGSPLSVWRQ